MVDQEFRQLLRDAEQRLSDQIKDVEVDVKALAADVKALGKFQSGFEGIAKLFGAVLAILTTAAVIYGTLK